ncbi:MAG: hypothetical protein DME49_12060 [Verrucomicrobia bacterium]|nr:MAG: hypothetical protein DME49_12060 [Verrucomicrobiota bacterium]PYK93484.1 MAG: hypothetical protein DME36_09230 [Verrucomicrobiota bacterium]
MVRTFHYFLAMVCGLTLAAAAEPKHTYMPPAGYVPDEATAIKIAVAVWEPIYGAKLIASEKPFRAALHNGVWTVAVAEISKKDGTILRVSHSK